MIKRATEKDKKRKHQLRQIYFYLTEGCNLACRHCWIAPKYQTGKHSYPMLPLSLFRSIIDQAKLLGLSGIKLTGGEPLLHPEIYKIIQITQEQNLYLRIETNGILCTPDLAEKIATCKKPFVSVSLDGVDAETHEWVRGVSDCFKSSLIGIRNLVNAGIKTQIIMTIMRRNKKQIEAMIGLAESLGVCSVKFNVLQPTARGEKMHKEGESLPIEELVHLGQWIENTLSTLTSLHIFYSHPLAFSPLSKIFKDKGRYEGCDITGIIGVLANGSYALCGIGETVPESIFGNATEDNLENIWDNTPTLLELRNGLPNRFEGICRDCLMKDICYGGCIAQTFFKSKELWKPFWYCEEAQRLGLFPENRRRLIP